MKLLEYEAKNILKTASLPIPKSIVISLDSDVSSISTPIILKSQVPVGGRGKAGGVQIVHNDDRLQQVFNMLFDLEIKGYKPSKILGEEVLNIKNEHYLSLLIDRENACLRLMAHTNGGVEVESHNSEEFFSRAIDGETISSCSADLAAYLGYVTDLIEPFIRKLYNAFIKNDATLLEVNPLVYTDKNALVCGDCKMELDDAAAFRHPEWDFTDKPHDANFVVLDPNGTVATIANGAGLDMATVDAVAVRGLTPANFLDIGGGANTESVLRAFQKIVEFPAVQAIVINIFAGITRCDEVAKAIIAAKKQIPNLPPLFIRLAGTNFEEAVALLSTENIPTLATLEDCLEAASQEVNNE
ncbi:MAG TPA: succinate--CoA ligase subunit beta [Candidatus Chromulinivoraceae bacterium]|nr:succinate--CoA ligase subunit beta [Candidatus Chromulinivoraceae bacterium]